MLCSTEWPDHPDRPCQCAQRHDAISDQTFHGTHPSLRRLVAPTVQGRLLYSAIPTRIIRISATIPKAEHNTPSSLNTQIRPEPARPRGMRKARRFGKSPESRAVRGRLPVQTRRLPAPQPFAGQLVTGPFFGRKAPSSHSHPTEISGPDPLRRPRDWHAPCTPLTVIVPEFGVAATCRRFGNDQSDGTKSGRTGNVPDGHSRPIRGEHRTGRTLVHPGRGSGPGDGRPAPAVPLERGLGNR